MSTKTEYGKVGEYEVIYERQHQDVDGEHVAAVRVNGQYVGYVIARAAEYDAETDTRIYDVMTEPFPQYVTAAQILRDAVENRAFMRKAVKALGITQ